MHRNRGFVADARDVLGGARILIVEDDPMNLEILAGLLASSGVVVSRANNGKQAIEFLRHERVDCVLMDLDMPVMGGIEATALIRATPEYSQVPIIAMTADSAHESGGRCFAVGMNEFLQKPFGIRSLCTVLQKWLPARAEIAH